MASFGTLYTIEAFTHPRSRKCLATAALAGLTLTIPPGFAYGTNKEPEFVAKFPLALFPTFEGPSPTSTESSASADSKPFLLTESYAITYYFADSAATPGLRERLLGATPAQRARVQQWLWFAQLHLETATTPMCVWRLGLTKYDQAVEDKAQADLVRYLGHMEKWIKGRRWFADGDDVAPATTNADEDLSGVPSIADVALGGFVFIAFKYCMDPEMRKEYPEVERWYEDFSSIPEIKELFPGPLLEVKHPIPASDSSN